jgi:hypothetical protein
VFQVCGVGNGSFFSKDLHLVFKHKTDLQVKKSQKLCQLPTREVQLASCDVGSITQCFFFSPFLWVLSFYKVWEGFITHITQSANVLYNTASC